MDLDLVHYKKNVIVVDNPRYANSIALNEVNRGNTTSIHPTPYEPIINSFSTSIVLNLRAFKFLNRRDFGESESSGVQKSITASATLDISSGSELSYFGTDQSVQKINIIFKENDVDENEISLRTVLKQKTEEKKFKVAPSERIDLYVKLSAKEFEIFYHDAELNYVRSILQLEISLKERCGIYVNSSGGVGKHKFKLLTREILEQSDLKRNDVTCADGNIFKQFSFNWVPSKSFKDENESDKYFSDRSKRSSRFRNASNDQLIFGSENLIWILVILGIFAGAIAYFS